MHFLTILVVPATDLGKPTRLWDYVNDRLAPYCVEDDPHARMDGMRPYDCCPLTAIAPPSADFRIGALVLPDGTWHDLHQRRYHPTAAEQVWWRDWRAMMRVAVHGERETFATTIAQWEGDHPYPVPRWWRRFVTLTAPYQDGYALYLDCHR